jgi:hypothetical protein
VHGLSIASAIELPELEVRRLPDLGPSEVTIAWGRVPQSMPGAIESVEGFEIAGDRILVAIDEVGRYLVERGERITVEPDEEGPEELVRLFLYGAAFSALAQQRGLMALHASAVVVGGRAIAFAGRTLQGKSTLASALGSLGHAILADDKVVIEPGPCGTLVAHPGPPALSLFEEAAQSSGQPTTARTSDLVKFGKHMYLVPWLCASEPAPVAAICFLDWTDGEELAIEPLDPFDAMLELRRNINTPSLVSLLGNEHKFLSWAKRLMAQAPAFAVSRPSDMGRLQDVAEHIVERVADSYA